MIVLVGSFMVALKPISVPFSLVSFRVMRASTLVSLSVVSVSYTHLTLPTKRIVEISVVAVSLTKQKALTDHRPILLTPAPSGPLHDISTHALAL